MMEFIYEKAFSRNIGWVTQWEQQLLKDKKVSIAGMGGVGGSHLLSMIRLGVENFHIADFDYFEVENFNRQVGATINNLGKDKSSSLKSMALDINPDASIKIFPTGITENNIDDFLKGTDVYIDGLDFFALDIREKLFKRCHELGIPAVTAAPLGMGSAYIIFDPDGMSFEEYFGLNEVNGVEKYIAFLIGLAPKALHRSYLVDPTQIRFTEKYGPSTGMACQVCSAVASVEALKIMLGRGKVYPAPYYHQFDAYTGKYIKSRTFLGRKNPLYTLKKKLAMKAFGQLNKHTEDEPIKQNLTAIPGDWEEIIELARWAPSGDNEQPWRFKIIDSKKLDIEVVFNESNLNIYEYDNGRPIWISIGTLIESIKIAASKFAKEIKWEHKIRQNKKHIISISLEEDETIKESDLLPFIKLRYTNRKNYQTTPLTELQKSILSKTVSSDYEVRWLEKTSEKAKVATISAMAFDIRLRIDETYDIHQRILEWDNPFSENKIPVSTLPISRLSKSLMRWSMKSRKRLHILTNYFGGTIMPQIEMDIVPAFKCAAHFVILNKSHNKSKIENLINAGQNVQRFWLTTTKLGLTIQPNFAPLVFGFYSQNKIAFSKNQKVINKARKILNGLQKLIGKNQDNAIFMGRIGNPQSKFIYSRSIRKPVQLD